MSVAKTRVDLQNCHTRTNARIGLSAEVVEVRLRKIMRASLHGKIDETRQGDWFSFMSVQFHRLMHVKSVAVEVIRGEHAHRRFVIRIRAAITVLDKNGGAFFHSMGIVDAQIRFDEGQTKLFEGFVVRCEETGEVRHVSMSFHRRENVVDGERIVAIDCLPEA